MSRRVRVLVVCALAALPFLIYSQFLSNDRFLYGYDAGQSHFARFSTLCNALQNEAALPLWQTIAYAGSPFHANPENASLYPPVLLLAAFLPPLLALNLTVLIHLSAGILGMYALVARLWRRIGGGPEAALAGPLVAAALFGMNAWYRLEHFNLVTYGAAHALIPWIFLAADGVLAGARPRQAAGTLALLLGAQFLTGGLYVFVYSGLALAVWFVFLGLLGGEKARRRALTWGLLAAALATLMALAKVVPYLTWVVATNRAGPLEEAVATGVTLGGKGVFAWETAGRRLLSYTGGGLMLLLVGASLPLRRRAIVRVVLGLALLGAVTSTGVLHGFLYDWVPPFNRIRNAVRAWTLANAFLPVAAGLGVCHLVARRWRKRPSRWLDPLAGCCLVLAALPLLLDTGRHQQFLDDPQSFREVLGYYPKWTKLARLTRGNWRLMCLNVRTAGTRNEQFIASALGVETPAGFFGYAYPLALGRHAYHNAGPLEPDVRAKRLEVLSVRYATYNLDYRLRVSPLRGGAFPGGVDGPRVAGYEHARPRAFVPARVAAVLGDPDRDVLYALFDDPAFQPRYATLLSLDADALPTEEELLAFDEIVTVAGSQDSWPDWARVLKQARRAGTPITTVELPLDEEARGGLAEVAARLSRPANGTPPGATFTRISSHQVRVTREGSGFVVLSETWPLYGGWVARAGKRTLPIRSADGVAAALYLRPGEKGFTASYEPPDVTRGLRFGAAGLLSSLLLLLPWPGRRRMTKASSPA